MLIGVPKEIKVYEYRVGLTPAGARELALHGHQVIESFRRSGSRVFIVAGAIRCIAGDMI
ncbi:hypothetical protein X880_4153 [Burkholderia pseudomallei MSHR4032]|nr:hypothetical protein X945_3322 [Burkholderia pseudomallei ABCPW 107]KGU90177.1 hypothetical protein X880_4153 [Burkholderia pseudomallei MSHR4032]KGV18616.1 hypothetical protein X895_4193 [Burkholderia pseudomallei MSHR4503]KGV44597.1 hypothetical protein X985_1852 [Burkholderia pseudomallei MSHR4012]KGV54851.1 hypothetical protein X983_2940 [Burkholderia pseudomallei MSHR4003]ONA11001.1 hypothetical protein AQ876_05465 [Burkholderia pseudomallei]